MTDKNSVLDKDFRLFQKQIGNSDICRSLPTLLLAYAHGTFRSGLGEAHDDLSWDLISYLNLVRADLRSSRSPTESDCEWPSG